jgi:hypothetical protein
VEDLHKELGCPSAQRLIEMMSQAWPYDVKASEPFFPVDPLRPFRCILFMPFKSEFAVVAELVRTRVHEVAEQLFQSYGLHLPEIKRIEWVRSSGVIQNQIWKELLAADLVFCDITEHNPNVMFEAGVAAGWKPIYKTVFIRNKESEAKHPFDLSPFRYIDYDLTDEGIRAFKEDIEQVTREAIIPFPDEQIISPEIKLPVSIDFSTGLDDLRLYTPPYCHRRVIDGCFQFGSVISYPHSWVSVGNARLKSVRLEFNARFGLISSIGPLCKIGVALRSQNFYANFGHVVVLSSDGSILVTEPNNDPPGYYANIDVREATEIDPASFHSFELEFNDSEFNIAIDDFSIGFQVSDMKRVFGPGLVRFHATRSWMEISDLSISAA